MIFTNKKEIAHKLRLIREHGMTKDKNNSIRLGLNSRLDTIQAAILLAKFEVFESEISNRQVIAERYNEAFEKDFFLQKIDNGFKSVFAQYSVISKSRKKTEIIFKNS